MMKVKVFFQPSIFMFKRGMRLMVLYVPVVRGSGHGIIAHCGGIYKIFMI